MLPLQGPPVLVNRSVSSPSPAAQAQPTLPRRAVVARASKADEEHELLSAENRALRQALAQIQGTTPDKVQFKDRARGAGGPQPSRSYGPLGPGGRASNGSPVASGEWVERQKAAAAAEWRGGPHAGPGGGGPQPGEGPSLDELREGIAWPEKGEEPPFWTRNPRRSYAPLGEGLSGAESVEQDSRRLNIVHCTAEMAPVAKVGGLGDVVTGLARACLSRGHQVQVLLPFYECIPDNAIEELKHECDFDCPKGFVRDGYMHGGSLVTQAFRGRVDGIPVGLLRPHRDHSAIFRGGSIYGGHYNEMEAYLYFSRACLHYLQITNQRPDIIHVHEWQLCALPMLIWDTYGDLAVARVMLTVHNLDSTGECRQDEFGHTGVSGDHYASVDKALDERTIGHNPERLSLLKGGMIYSNAVTTVSPTYARELLDGGAGWLRGTLSEPAVRAKFQGLLNGIDRGLWDPATDPNLAAPFSAQRPEGKRLCKEFLQRGLGLSIAAEKPLVGVVTRLVPQKGIHLIRHAVYRTAELGGQFVLLGTGHAAGDFRHMADHDFRDSSDVKLLLMYSEALAHQIYAAADIFLVPSLFEPCGLTQLVALQYGGVPVVRSTGGLADTVTDREAGQERANGYVFGGADTHSVDSALERAFRDYRSRPKEWEELQRRNMREDNSWEKAAEQYLDTYKQLLDARYR